MRSSQRNCAGDLNKLLASEQMTNRSIEYTYVSLWTAFCNLKALYDDVRENFEAKDNALALRLAALAVLFFALEAFLNHIIQFVRPEVWEKEREFFSGKKPIDGVKYYGPIGKLQFVHALCNEASDENADAIQTFKNLKKLRDFMAHGRTIEDAPASIPILAYPPALTIPQLFELATDELLDESSYCVYSLRLSLFDKIAQLFPETDLGPSPNSGISMFQVATVS